MSNSSGADVSGADDLGAAISEAAVSQAEQGPLRPGRALLTSDETGTYAGYSAIQPAQPQPVATSRTATLHDALAYSARKLLIELRQAPASQETVLLHHLTPTTTQLLRWWFSDATCAARVDNFHIGQREAILHTVLAREILQSDDPILLRALACNPNLIADHAHPVHRAATPECASYVLRTAPGSGLRWIAQALMVWQWANHAALLAEGRSDPRYGHQLLLIASEPTTRAHLERALYGPETADGERDPMLGSLMRHARLFTPPALRAPLYGWLLAKLRSNNRTPLVVEATDPPSTQLAAVTLVAGTGVRVIGGFPPPTCSDPRTSASMLWVDIEHASQRSLAPHPPQVEALAEFDLPRAISQGVTKLPMLEHVACLDAQPLGVRAPQLGRRQRLRSSHQALLRQGLDALSLRDASFAQLDPARPPRMLVLCDAPCLLHAARGFLSSQSIDAFASGIDPYRDPALSRSARIVIDHLPAQSTRMDARICVIVILRTYAGDAACTGAELIHHGLPALWPEPDFASSRTRNRECALTGRPPDNLLDVLSVIDHPQCHAAFMASGIGLVANRTSTVPIQATGGLIVTRLRDDASAYDLLLPPLCADHAALEEAERLSSVPQRILQAKHAMAVRKSIYPLAGWDMDDNGLRRAFIATAELDDAVESHCLLDSRRHARRGRDMLLSLSFDGRSLIDAVVRTATHVFLVELLPFGPAQTLRADECEVALKRWCRRTNMLPPPQRSNRLWRRVQLQAPLFWSCKHSGVPLVTLLAALADTRVLAARKGARRPSGEPG